MKSIWCDVALGGGCAGRKVSGMGCELAMLAACVVECKCSVV